MLAAVTAALPGFGQAAAVTLTKAWTAIPLEETPLSITAHNGQLWVVGQKEMIAVSKDGGRTWEVRHHSAAGEMLFSLEFVNDATLHAAGSGHTWMTSVDGGAHWKLSNDLKLSWSQAGFSAGGFGIAADADAWGTTSNGGKKWQMYGLPLAPDALSPPTKPGGKLPDTPILHGLNRRVLAVSVLDEKRAAVLFAAEDGHQPWASTVDGGKTWQQSGLDQVMTLTGMRAAEGKFWIYGKSKADNSPVAMTSSETANWDNAPAPFLPYSSCTAQGCQVPGGWAQIAAGQTTLWQLPAPPAQVAATSWAASNDTSNATFCEVGDDRLYCTL
ncbi:MAG: WD40/YVTN/BNR-like repeat-containing protein, partial [Streptosporangiaceae bacterium]